MTELKAGLIALLFISLFPCPGAAQGVISINVWPPKIELNLAPGETRTGVITVDNKGSTRVKILASITDVGMGKNGGLVFPESGSLPYSCQDWILVNPEDFWLSQSASQQVRYTLKVPSDAQGTYLASIFFQTKPTEELTITGSKISARIGSLVIVTITGIGRKDAELSGLSLNNPATKGPAQIELGIKNKGNVILRPTGIIELKNLSGWTVEKLNFNESKQAVLPYSERFYEVPISPGVESGHYTLYCLIDYGGREMLSAETKVNIVNMARAWAEPARPQPQPPATQPRSRTTEPKAGRSEPARPKASPEEIKSLYSQGSKLYSSGDYQGALAVWQRILKLDPGNSAAAKNLDRTKSKLESLKKAKG